MPSVHIALWLKIASCVSSHPCMRTCVLRLDCFLLACLFFYLVSLFSFQPFLMFTSEFHERLKSKALCDFRLGTVATSDHETPLTHHDSGEQVEERLHQDQQRRGHSSSSIPRWEKSEWNWKAARKACVYSVTMRVHARARCDAHHTIHVAHTHIKSGKVELLSTIDRGNLRNSLGIHCKKLTLIMRNLFSAGMRLLHVKGMYPAPHIHEHLRYTNGYGKLRTSSRTT